MVIIVIHSDMMLLLHVSKGDILLIGEPLERFSTKRKRSLKSGRCYCTVADFFLSPFDSFVIVVLLARGGSVLTTKVVYSIYYKNYVYALAYKKIQIILKSPRNKKDLNDVTAAPFLLSFSQLPAAKKHTKNGEAVPSLRFFLFRDNFS